AYHRAGPPSTEPPRRHPVRARPERGSNTERSFHTIASAGLLSKHHPARQIRLSVRQKDAVLARLLSFIVSCLSERKNHPPQMLQTGVAFLAASIITAAIGPI